jgi:ATP-dependent Clp protease ATP-binding subunit ClpC
MSEYMERHNASRMIGAPPGYVGYEEGGQLTEQVRRKPYSVVLFDEIEKAHPEVMNMLLQILEEGKLTDNVGRVINFRNTVVLMTSNVGSDTIRKQTTLGFAQVTEETSYEKMRDKILEESKRVFRPEFLNRLDEIVLFRPLGEPEIEAIVRLQIEDLRRRLAEQDLKLDLSDKAVRWIVKTGFDPVYGARPLKRTIQRELETPIARRIVAGDFAPGATVAVDAAAEKLMIR